MKATLRAEDKSFETLGRCIFCCNTFSDEFPATDEHIIPEFLGGRVIVEDGSCKNCARQSNKLYETPAAQTTFLPYRLWSGQLGPVARGLPNIAVGNSLKGSEAEFRLPATKDTRPPVFTMVDFPPPIGIDVTPSQIHEKIRVKYVNFSNKEMRLQSNFYPRVDRKGRDQLIIRTYLDAYGVTIQERHDLQALKLLVAKIGYIFSIVKLGFDAYNHKPIRDLLAGRRKDIDSFVGGYAGELSELPRDAAHLVHLSEQSGVWSAIVHFYARNLNMAYEVKLEAPKMNSDSLVAN